VRTYSPKPADITRQWHVIDAEDVVLGRLAVEAATLLRGKHKATYAPHVDGGDFVVIINAEKVALSGNKAVDKQVFRHSGYPGGLKQIAYGDLLEKDARRRSKSPSAECSPRIVSAVNSSRSEGLRRPEHPHAAQKPSRSRSRRSPVSE
jgi:large subunit ribosomal protein L13